MLLFCFAMCVSAQELTVKGTVTDAKGEAIIGASVLVQGTTNGTITDFDGIFNLSNVPSKSNLVISYIGYKSQEIAVNGKTDFKVGIGRRY